MIEQRRNDGREPGGSCALGCLLEIAEVVVQQRAAIIACDAAALTAQTDRLAQRILHLLDELSVPEDEAPIAREAAELVSLARRLREETRYNAALLASGMAILDHFAGCLAAASQPDRPLLLSGVA